MQCVAVALRGCMRVCLCACVCVCLLTRVCATLAKERPGPLSTRCRAGCPAHRAARSAQPAIDCLDGGRPVVSPARHARQLPEAAALASVAGCAGGALEVGVLQLCYGCHRLWTHTHIHTHTHTQRQIGLCNILHAVPQAARA